MTTRISTETLFNRTGYLAYDEETNKGIFAYHDAGVMPDTGTPFNKFWVCDVFRIKYKKKDGFGPWRFNWIHSTQKSFNKLGVQMQQLPMLIKLASMLYRDATGETVDAPEEVKDVQRPDEIESLLAQIEGRRKR